MRKFKCVFLSFLLFLNNLIFTINHKCTNEWIVKIENQSNVEIIAKLNGFSNKGRVKPFEDVYKFVFPGSSECKKEITRNLSNSSDVIWAEQQVVKIRTKRNFFESKLSRRSQELAYNRLTLNDPFWDREWYLVSLLVFQIDVNFSVWIEKFKKKIQKRRIERKISQKMSKKRRNVKTPKKR